MSAADSIAQLVQGFARNIAELTDSEYKESEVRLEYIDRFWELLGWDVQNKAQRTRQNRDVFVERSMDTVDEGGMRSRSPDYLFRTDEFPRFIVEAKKPSIHLDQDKNAIYQAKRYAWNATIPFAILTNFSQFRLYDTTLKPILNEPTRGLIRDFSLNFQDYPDQWDVLVSTFGRDAVSGGSLEQLRGRIRNASSKRRLRTVDRMLFELKGDEPVDRVFLDYLEKHRQQFASEIYARNKKDFSDADTLHGAARLTEAVQRLIDRLVFMRICEDRGIERYGTLRDTLDRVSAEGGELYRTLCARFRELDVQYNGYLFKYHFSEDLTIPGDTLSDFIRTLYPPEGPWDFARIGDDILGIVYERFLGHTVTVKHGHAVVEEKPEVRHAGGVYYTPRFVVDTIIRRVIGPKVTGKSPMQVLDVKVLDPACGSGSFLVAAFQYLINHCLAAIVTDPTLASTPASPKARKKRREIAFKNGSGGWNLSPDFKAALLTNCIHGVDIDQQAVEVTVMSLYLKMLEGALPKHWQHDWLENQLLPSLDNNVHCGNSLIDSESFDEYLVHTHGGLFPIDEDVRFRVNRFDWTSRTRGFGRLLDSDAVKARDRQGFDCIIGNPPYIRVQELKKWAPEECEFFKWKYDSARKGNYDIYVVFTEKALNLLAPDGHLGFIMPHKWWQANYGEGLRRIIAEGNHLEAVVDFADQQVFRGATTYTAVHVIGKQQRSKVVDYAKVFDLQDGVVQCAALDAGKRIQGAERYKARRPKGGGPWVFASSAVSGWLDRVRGSHRTLGEITHKIAQGLVSGCDGAFYLERRGNVYLSEHTRQTHEVEKALLHPLLKGSVHIRRWLFDRSKVFVLFPYQQEKREWALIEPTMMKSKYPRAYEYLLLCRKKLEEREKGRFSGERFYQYSRPQNFEVMERPKILVPAIAQRGQYALDAKGEHYFVGSGGGGGGAHAVCPNGGIDLHYLCGLLNSKLLDAFLQRITTPFHSGWFAYSKAYIAQIPIKLPETKDENKLADRITDSVRIIMDAKVRLRDAKLSDRERKALEGEVEFNEKRIDEAVFRLYGVDGLPE
jgi:hypothetical protein